MVLTYRVTGSSPRGPGGREPVIVAWLFSAGTSSWNLVFGLSTPQPERSANTKRLNLTLAFAIIAFAPTATVRLGRDPDSMSPAYVGGLNDLLSGAMRRRAPNRVRSK